jgi:hypothetical protein
MRRDRTRQKSVKSKLVWKRHKERVGDEERVRVRERERDTHRDT